jgi:hypothetical protein
MPQVILTSEEFGSEEFEYDTMKQARAGFERMKESCQAETDNDGIERRLILALETWTTD